ncbi:hypothetical protein NC651_014208 [Populus alba x Populus x berolinensis]|nr:hypothetical protein NC651_014208 [Populus alba x Populus x berolinensis]
MLLFYVDCGDLDVKNSSVLIVLYAHLYREGGLPLLGRENTIHKKDNACEINNGYKNPKNDVGARF